MGFTVEVAEGRQGSTRFFTGSMEWGEVAKHSVLPHQLSDELGDEGDDEQRMQRGLATKRLPILVDYLEEPDHFFSALTLIVLPSDLTRPAEEARPEDDEGDFMFVRAPKAGLGKQKRGTLHLSASVRIFPADGQHRLAAAIEAMKANRATLAKEEVPVVLVPYTGPDQVRQLFADLNLNAKPVSRTIGLDFDTRTPVVLLAKRVAKRVRLFEGRVNRVSNSLSKTSGYVISMNSLVEGTRNLLFGLLGERDPRAQDEAVQELQNEGEEIDESVVAAWNAVIDPFLENWELVLAGVEGAAGALRSEYVYPHGLGWQALTSAAGELMREYGEEWMEIFARAVQSIDWSRANPDWQGVAMTEDRVNNTGPGIKATAAYVLSKARSLATA